jgi:hypothetical protein
MKNIACIGYGFKGQLQASIVENGRVVRQFDPTPNLILNQGLDQFASNSSNSLFQYAVAGTGVTATEIDSATDTATIAAGAVTLSTTGYLAGDASDVGRTIKLDTSGNVYTITAFGSTTACTVTPPNTEGPDTFIIYNTNQTGLAAEVKRTNTYLTGAPNCQTVTIGNLTTMTRTFDFSAEVGPVGYNEVGFSTTGTAGSNLFSRVKLPTTVNLIAGQQLRVRYSVQIAITPITPQTYGTSPIIGWAGATGTLQCTSIPLNGVNTSGGQIFYGTNPVDGKVYTTYGEPSTGGGGYAQLVISTNSAASNAYGVNTVLGGTQEVLTWTLSTYTNGTYFRDKFVTFPVGSANRSDWRSFGCHDFNSGTSFVRFIFDSNQTKLSTYTLTLGFRQTWNRVL